MAGQWLLSEVRAALLLEFQADVGQQEDWTETGAWTPLINKSLSPAEHSCKCYQEQMFSWLVIMEELPELPVSDRATLCPSAPLQEVRAGGVRQMFIQAFHHPPDGLRVRGARVWQLPRVHHRRRVSNSPALCLSPTLSLCELSLLDLRLCLSFPVELPRRPSMTASTALFTCTTRPPLETCSPLALTRLSRCERKHSLL